MATQTGVSEKVLAILEDNYAAHGMVEWTRAQIVIASNGRFDAIQVGNALQSLKKANRVTQTRPVSDNVKDGSYWASVAVLEKSTEPNTVTPEQEVTAMNDSSTDRKPRHDSPEYQAFQLEKLETKLIEQFEVLGEKLIKNSVTRGHIEQLLTTTAASLDTWVDEFNKVASHDREGFKITLEALSHHIANIYTRIQNLGDMSVGIVEASIKTADSFTEGYGVGFAKGWLAAIATGREVEATSEANSKPASTEPAIAVTGKNVQEAETLIDKVLKSLERNGL